MKPECLGVADIPLYLVIRRRMLDDSPWSFSSSPEEDRGLDPEQLEQTLRSPDAAVLGIRSSIDASVPGTAEALVAVATTSREPRAKRRRIAWIMGVFVAPEWRGRGLGEAVVRALLVPQAGPG